MPIKNRITLLIPHWVLLLYPNNKNIHILWSRQVHNSPYKPCYNFLSMSINNNRLYTYTTFGSSLNTGLLVKSPSLFGDFAKIHISMWPDPKKLVQFFGVRSVSQCLRHLKVPKISRTQKVNLGCNAVRNHYLLFSGLLKYLPTSRAMRIVK